MSSSLDQDRSQPPDSTIDSTPRSRGIESILEKLDDYILTKVAEKMEQVIRQRLQGGGLH